MSPAGTMKIAYCREHTPFSVIGIGEMHDDPRGFTHEVDTPIPAIHTDIVVIAVELDEQRSTESGEEYRARIQTKHAGDLI